MMITDKARAYTQGNQVYIGPKQENAVEQQIDKAERPVTMDDYSQGQLPLYIYAYDSGKVMHNNKNIATGYNISVGFFISDKNMPDLQNLLNIFMPGIDIRWKSMLIYYSMPHN